MVFYIGSLFLILWGLLQLPENSFSAAKETVIINVLILSAIWLLFTQKKFVSYLRAKFNNPLLVISIVFLMICTAATLIFGNFNPVYSLKALITLVLLIVLIYMLKPVKDKHHWKDIFILIYSLAVIQSKIMAIPLIQYIDLRFRAEYIIFAIILLWFYMVYKEIDIGFQLDLTWKSLGWVIVLAIFIPFDILLGMELKFISFDISQFSWNKLLIYSIFMFYFGSLIEELFFRGLLYNYFNQFFKDGKVILPLLISSLLFGLTHLFSNTYPMVILSFIAGIFYCLTFIKTKNLFCASLIHTITNLCWKLFFI